MIRLRKTILAATLAAGAMGILLPARAAQVYKLDLTRGSWPAGVTAANANGAVPTVSAYKHGYTTDGWCVDRYGSRGYVAVSPTHADTGCENQLTLPAMTPGDSDWLFWDALSALRNFPESYRVEALVAGSEEPVLLAEVNEEAYDWKHHALPLTQIAGKEATIRFVATSVRGYLLVLSDVKIESGYTSYLEFTNLTPAYQGLDEGEPTVSFTLDCVGADAELESVECRLTPVTEGETLTLTSGPLTIKSGESATVTFDIPAELPNGGAFEVSVAGAGENQLIAGGMGSGTTYVDAFRRGLMVDRGTGMWCVNCPEADVAVDKLRSQFGDALIMLSTHTNDALANEPYWKRLKWYSVPQLMLDRMHSTEGNGISKFEKQYYRPVRFGITLDQIAEPADGTLRFTANVRAAATTDNADGRYRIGYVVTSDFHDPANKDFLQRNSCNQPSYGVYYYLPSAIVPEFMYYDDVTLTSDGAFDGVEGSLPAELAEGEKYSFSCDVALPELLADPSKGRVVAFVVDTQTGYVENAVALGVGEVPPSAGMESVAAPEARMHIGCDAHGNATVVLPEGERYTLEAFRADGYRVFSTRRVAAGSEKVALPLDGGIYMLRLTSESGTKTLKTLVRR